MCGIAGIINRSPDQQVNQQLINDMVSSIVHRGPDSGGIYLGRGLAIGHRRLAIIAPEDGHQPLCNEDRTLVLTYNGEIYNYRDLAVELKELGFPVHSDSDTEVVLRAWEAWGTECVNRFRGMFAFAVWDEKLQILFIARDRFGKKPLFYSITADGQFIFGSELKSLVLHPEIKRDLNPFAVEDYFAYGYIPDPKTIYRDIHRLPPGYYGVFDRKSFNLKISQYWDLPERLEPRLKSSHLELQNELVERLSEAIKIRLRSDVPLGAFLSGGADSSSVVALMQQVCGLQRTHTFSIGFEDKSYDESEYARKTAVRYNCEHHETILGDDSARLFDKISNLYDEPFADSSALPTYIVSELARKSVIVALSGDGGDELFAGYRNYRLHSNQERVRALLPHKVRHPLFSLLGTAYPKADWAPRICRAKRIFQSLAHDSLTGFGLGNMITIPLQRKALFADSFRSELQDYDAMDVLRYHFNNAPTDDPLAIAQYLDMKVYLPSDILTKVDRASMAHGLEVRVPMLDHEFAEWAWQLPSEWKLRAGKGKFLLKSAMEKHLDHDLLWRKKMGFSIPLGSWLKKELKNHVVALTKNSLILESNIFNPDTINKIVGSHFSGTRDYSDLIWALLMFENFLRKQSGVHTQYEGASSAERVLYPCVA